MVVYRCSKYHLPTRKEEPKEAEIVSHRLMLRAGMIRQLSQGIYNFLPLGYRVLRKIEQIVREEMNRAGGQEVLMPIMQPRELWEETGRWDVYGPEMLRLHDRHEREYGLGPTHEEVVTDLVRDELTSYRDCPLILYQIATKFRDEIRPRFGVMRGREFMMKDAYSFDADEEGARESYRLMDRTYQRIFDRIGLNYRKVEAATGAIGGSLSHEFMVLAETGEDRILSCEQCGYAANQEQAEGTPAHRPGEANGQPEPLEKFETPGVETIEGLMDVDSSATSERQIKTMVMRVKGRPTALLVPGNDQLNETRLDQVAGGEVEAMTPGEIKQEFGAHPGSLGAVNLPHDDIQVWSDPSLEGRQGLYTGANEDGYHYRNVSMDRDIEVDRWVPLRVVQAGDFCPECDEPLREQAGIEVGHIFYLGEKYSRQMNAEIQQPDGSLEPMVMGCYGIGVSRIMAAAIEQSHDDQGIVWPPSIAPFDVYLLPVHWDNEDQRTAAQEMAEELDRRGYDVLLDDRDESPGVKFNESELLGIPIRVTFGRDLDQGEVELTLRAGLETENIPLGECLERIQEEWEPNG